MVLDTQLRKVRTMIEDLAKLRQRAADQHDWSATCEVNEQLNEMFIIERQLVSRIGLRDARRKS